MGKYMKKTKIAGEVAVMEVAHHSGLGVRTRARTLALQRLQKPADDEVEVSPPPPAESYLQLRSRRLEKPLPPPPKLKEPKPSPSPKASGRVRAASANSGSVGSAGSARSCRDEVAPEVDGGVEASFGENFLDVEIRDRSVRETTPCSLVRGPETIGTPGSTTRPTNSTASNRRMQSSIRRNIPTAHEMDEFFAGAEQLQQKMFMEKYNYDPVNDVPLPGRYEWVKLDS